MLSEGWRTVLGGFLVHLVLGTLYLWANVTSAVTSYLRTHDSSIDYNSTIKVYATTLLSQGMTIFLGGMIAQRIGARYCCLLGGFIIVCSAVLASYATSVEEILFAEGVLLGAGIGICYTAPVAAAVKWMPERKGLVSGIILGGFGCGAFVYGLVATHIVNPNKLSVDHSGSNANYFPPDSPVVANVPTMYRTLAMIYSVMIVAGCMLMTEPKDNPSSHSSNGSIVNSTSNPIRGRSTVGKRRDQLGAYQYASTEDEDSAVTGIELGGVGRDKDCDKSLDHTSATSSAEEEVSLSPQETVRMGITWHLASCFISTTVGGVYLAGVFKTFAQQSFSDEAFLSTIAALASVFNSFGRVVWGSIADRIGALPTLLLMSLLFSVTTATYYWSISFGQTGFAIWTFLIFFFEGANFVLYVPMCVQLFGAKYAAGNYGLVFTAYSLSVSSSITLMASQHVDFKTAALSMGALTFAGFLNLLLLGWHMRLLKRQAADSSDLRMSQDSMLPSALEDCKVR